jgi:hypothetical protein
MSQPTIWVDTMMVTVEYMAFWGMRVYTIIELFYSSKARFDVRIQYIVAIQLYA